MREAAREAIDFTDGQKDSEFYADRKTQRAVVMSLFLVGATAATIMDFYPETALGNPDVPWRAIRGMRNRIAHNFHALEIDIVWKTVRDSLPALLRTLEELR